MVRVSEWVVTLGSRGDSKAIKTFEELLMCLSVWSTCNAYKRISGTYSPADISQTELSRIDVPCAY